MAATTLLAPTRRTDPEFRALVCAANEGLALRGHPWHPSTRSAGWSKVGAILAFVALLLLASSALFVRSRVLLAQASPPAATEDVGRFLSASGGAPSTGKFLVVSVTHPSDAPVTVTSDDMRWAARSALKAAQACTGAPAASLALNTHGERGASGGLIFALQLVDTFEDADLTAGRHIAGSGVVTPDGRVWPVKEMAKKAVAAQGAKVDVFLVEAGQAAKARAAAPALNVIGVKTLNDAVRALDGHGCRG
jgi:predicted S18 family serine protease